MEIETILVEGRLNTWPPISCPECGRDAGFSISADARLWCPCGWSGHHPAMTVAMAAALFEATRNGPVHGNLTLTRPVRQRRYVAVPTPPKPTPIADLLPEPGLDPEIDELRAAYESARSMLAYSSDRADGAAFDAANEQFHDAEGQLRDALETRLHR